MDGEKTKLFVFYLGGSAPGANIEVHDVQFAAVRKPEDAYPIMAEKWYGTRKGLHIDAYGIVDWADGHDVTLSPEKPAGSSRLFFVNMGGYLPGRLREDHQFAFFVAENEEDAKRKARNTLLVDYEHQHKDNLMGVDDCVLIDALEGQYVHLNPNPSGQPVRAIFQGVIWV